MSQDHFQKLEQMYLKAPINSNHYPGSQINISQGEAIVSLDVDEDYFHALNGVHGSVYFKLLDDAAFFAVNSLVTDYFVLTTSFNINLIRPVSKGLLTATGSVRFKSRNLFTAESVLKNESGKEIAFGTGNFTASRVELSSIESYR
ncbi:MAG TPA: PaaI family thioesterase [Cryomorphaceae bacterium]|nr:PaaI family thioesterase [Cryomorphaceae bacterium]